MSLGEAVMIALAKRETRMRRKALMLWLLVVAGVGITLGGLAWEHLGMVLGGGLWAYFAMLWALVVTMEAWDRAHKGRGKLRKGGRR